MSRPIDAFSDAGLRDLIGDLLSLVENRDRLTPSERIDVMEIAAEEARLDPLVYAEEDCTNCRHIPKKQQG